MECYSAIKKEQLLICTLTKVHLKITPEQKKNRMCRMIPLFKTRKCKQMYMSWSLGDGEERNYKWG